MKLKQEFIDILITCPFTGKVINTLFIETELYPHYFNCGLEHFFEKEIKPISDCKTEIELDLDAE